MEKQKLRFDIQKIPEGESSKKAKLPKDYYELDDEMKLLGADIIISFYRTDRFIKVSFDVNSSVELICDRSLDLFEKTIEGTFDILFQPDEIQESETERSAVKQIPADDLVIDIEDEVRDTIMLNIPIKKVHPRFIDETGKPEEFGIAKFGESDDDDEDPIDPRWEKLKKLK